MNKSKKDMPLNPILISNGYMHDMAMIIAMYPLDMSIGFSGISFLHTMQAA
jgi:hypothetical protein